MLNDGSLEFHEVKGGKNGTGNQWIYWAEEDAKVKLKVAATIQPLPLFVVYPARGGVIVFGTKEQYPAFIDKYSRYLTIKG